jgi:DNA adenine methylase
LYNNKEKYNLKHPFIIAIFLFIRNYAYSWMFRYNQNWDFNVPYGWIWYNNNNFTKKIDYLKSEELKNHLLKTKIENLDFEDFFIKNKPQKNDFIFLDPPYDSEFSTYDKNIFNRKDQKRLANYLIKDCKAKWMMIIKNTDFIFDLYNKKDLNIKTFDKKYLVNFMNRNDKEVKHLLITNY